MTKTAPDPHAAGAPHSQDSAYEEIHAAIQELYRFMGSSPGYPGGAEAVPGYSVYSYPSGAAPYPVGSPNPLLGFWPGADVSNFVPPSPIVPMPMQGAPALNEMAPGVAPYGMVPRGWGTPYFHRPF